MTELSVVVVAFNMNRELPRTIRSLSPAMQQGIRAEDYELIIVDNGSRIVCDEATCPTFGATTRWFSSVDPNRSPARAVNLGIAAARGEIVGVLVDGARIASPGLLAGALNGAKLHARPVIASLGFHLGREVQMVSVSKGYDQTVEDALLLESKWESDGYNLFDIAVFAGSSAGGWFAPMAESNALFMPRNLWAELGGYEEAFLEPGGGLVNLDTYRRACLLPGARLVLLLGEGTFHQVHGGIATNALTSPWVSFHDEYVRIRKQPYVALKVEPLFVGKVRPQALRSIAQSLNDPAAACWDLSHSS
jgi:glycosyl transferase family 2